MNAASSSTRANPVIFVLLWALTACNSGPDGPAPIGPRLELTGPQTIAPGESFDLIEGNVPLANILTVPARIKETWTVSCVNAPDDTNVLRYKIKPRPQVAPPTP